MNLVDLESHAFHLVSFFFQELEARNTTVIERRVRDCEIGEEFLLAGLQTKFGVAEDEEVIIVGQHRHPCISSHREHSFIGDIHQDSFSISILFDLIFIHFFQRPA